MTFYNFVNKPVWRRYSVMDFFALPLTILLFGIIVHFVYTYHITSNKVDEMQTELHNHFSNSLQMIMPTDHADHSYIAICEGGHCTYYKKTEDISNVKNN